MSIETMRQALEYIERHAIIDGIPVRDALRQAIEQAEKVEPVGIVDCADTGDYSQEWFVELVPNAHQIADIRVGTKLYTTAPTAPAQPVVSTEHGPWIESKHPGEEGECYCQRCLLRDKFLGSRGCEPHIAPTAPTQKGCPVLCELCIKRGYSECVNVTVTTPLPTAPAQQPLTEDQIDAARYRWLFNDISLTVLKQSFDNNTPLSPDSLHSAVIEQIVGFYTVKEDADAVIDAAMKGEKK